MNTSFCIGCLEAFLGLLRPLAVPVALFPPDCRNPQRSLATNSNARAPIPIWQRGAESMRYLNMIGPQVRKLRYTRQWSQNTLSTKLQLLGWDVDRAEY